MTRALDVVGASGYWQQRQQGRVEVHEHVTSAGNQPGLPALPDGADADLVARPHRGQGLRLEAGYYAACLAALAGHRADRAPAAAPVLTTTSLPMQA